LKNDVAGTKKEYTSREVEAEAVALLCCEALNIEGDDYCRGYIQNWLGPVLGNREEVIPEKSAQKIFRAADQILRAGRLRPDQNDEQVQQPPRNQRKHDTDPHTKFSPKRRRIRC